MANMQICTKCNQEKLFEEFYWRNKSKNKRHTICKICSEQSRKNKEHYLKYKEKYLIRAKKNKRLNREKNCKLLLEYLKHNFCKCGESDPIVLEFHHIDKKNKEISKMLSSYSWKSILSEISLCQVLCANCHKRETAKEFKWYKII